MHDNASEVLEMEQKLKAMRMEHKEGIALRDQEIINLRETRHTVPGMV